MRTRLSLVPVLTLAAAVAACSDDSLGPPSGVARDSVAPEIVAWLRSSVHPFDTAEPGSGFEDLAFLRDMIGSARVVALGEATHGTHEFVRMKHRVLEFLVEEMGFNTFALEATWPESNRVNAFVHTGQGDPLALLSGLYFWTCCPEEVLDMVLWMREHNRDPGNAPRVSFYGFDMQFPGMAIHNVLTFLDDVDPAAAAWVSGRYDCLTPFANGPGEGTSRVVLYGQQPLAYRNACLADLEAVHDSVMAARDTWETASSTAAFARVARSARILVQFEVKESARIPGARDLFMAENVGWLLDQAGPDAKIVLSAHNGHVADDPYFDGGGSLGHHLRTRSGDDLVIVGFDFHHGGFQAITVTDAGTLAGLNDHYVEYPPRGSYEYYFHS
ncbi:MAG: erythromycin esterase family protein, partial [Gemmatimonadota bacterium]